VTSVKKINLMMVVVFLVTLASVVAGIKWGYGFSRGR
jgi:hypothetical protein